MTDEGLPAGHEFMSLEAIDRVRRQKGAKTRQDAVVARIGPRELGPKDGVIEPTSWSQDDIPVRQWIVKGLIPSATVTMLTGNGGEGKSLLAMQLLTASVTRTRWLGRHVKPVTCLGVWCEDDEDELKRRANSILKPQGLLFKDLDNLTFIDRDAKDSLLFEGDQYEGQGRITPFYEQLWETVRSLGAELLVLDSLYNFFAGNENSRPHANAFIGALKRMAKELNCAIVLVAHPSMSGMASGNGTAGNTAWHNSVRARLYMHRLKHPSGDPELKGDLVLQPMKSNYGPVQDRITILWEDGRFVAVVDPQEAPLPYGEQF